MVSLATMKDNLCTVRVPDVLNACLKELNSISKTVSPAAEGSELT